MVLAQHRRLLRLALGTTLSFVTAEMLDWELSFVITAFLVQLLTLPGPAPGLRQGIATVLVLGLATGAAATLSGLLVDMPALFAIVLGLVLFARLRPATERAQPGGCDADPGRLQPAAGDRGAGARAGAGRRLLPRPQRRRGGALGVAPARAPAGSRGGRAPAARPEGAASPPRRRGRPWRLDGHGRAAAGAPPRHDVRGARGARRHPDGHGGLAPAQPRRRPAGGLGLLLGNLMGGLTAMVAYELLSAVPTLGFLTALLLLVSLVYARADRRRHVARPALTSPRWSRSSSSSAWAWRPSSTSPRRRWRSAYGTWRSPASTRSSR